MKVSEVIYGMSEQFEAEVSDFRHVVGIELGEGYNWDSLEAWYSPSRRKFFWLSDSGCSCNCLGMGAGEIGAFESGNRDELASAVRRKYDEQCSSATGLASALLRDLATVKTFRAAVSND